jgi:hypothetical protein
MSALPSSALASSLVVEPRIAVLSLLTQAARDDTVDDTVWLAICSRLTPRVERLSPRSAALDFGFCAEQEALRVARGLMDRLRWVGARARIGVGPTVPLAQLAALTCSPPPRIVLVSAADAPAFLAPLPVESFCALQLPVPITNETVTRLRRYGITIIGQLARLEASTLRRQFGAVGALLATLARGESPTPFHPTPPSPSLRFRTRFPTPLDADQFLRRLPQLTEEIAVRLRTQGDAAGALHVTVWWDTGALQHASTTLHARTQDPRRLAQELTRLLTPLLTPALTPCLPPRASGPPEQIERIERLDVRLSDLAPLAPWQDALWSPPRPLRAERLRRTAMLAETLAQRHHHPMLLTARLTAEASPFSEDRYRLTPLTPDTLADTIAASRASSRAQKRQGDRWRDAPIQPHWW